MKHYGKQDAADSRLSCYAGVERYIVAKRPVFFEDVMAETLCKTYRFSSVADFAPLREQLSRRAAADGADAAKTDEAVRAILQAVREKGLSAVLDYTRRFDCPEFTESMFAVPRKDLAKAAAAIPEDDREILRKAIRRIRRFHEAQKEKAWFITEEDGTVLGQTVTPLDRAGLYVPGGQGGETPLISSLLMNAIPAQVAGVPAIAVVSPPREDGSLNPYILAAAHELKLTEVYACGSAWAVAALAFGAGPLKPVDLIAGPGNIWVTTAKRLLLGQVGIDMLAGPSEICVVAERGAKAAWVAADMLSQAEHDPLASALCITPDEALAAGVQAELAVQAARLPRAEVARQSLEHWGGVIVTPDMGTALAIANALAPEHLELLVDEPWKLLPAVRHAGAVFMGHYAAESAGDYFAGPNHVLPTMGTARFSSALSVQTFCKKSSILAVSPAFAGQNAAAIARLARLEGLEAHARSIEERISG